jgi:hypothetical protein
MGSLQSCEEVSLSQTEDNSTGLQEQYEYRYIECMASRWGLAPFGFIGVVLNLLALWVWTAEREFKPLTFFLKCLAAFDIL